MLFYHRSTTKRLNTIVEKVTDVVKEKIEKEISAINNLILFDDDFTSGKPWEVDELLRVNK